MVREIDSNLADIFFQDLSRELHSQYGFLGHVHAQQCATLRGVIVTVALHEVLDLGTVAEDSPHIRDVGKIGIDIRVGDKGMAVDLDSSGYLFHQFVRESQRGANDILEFSAVARYQPDSAIRAVNHAFHSARDIRGVRIGRLLLFAVYVRTPTRKSDAQEILQNLPLAPVLPVSFCYRSRCIHLPTGSLIFYR